MQIVILDGFALNPGDLDWGELKNIGKLDVYERTPDALILERAKDAQVILTNKGNLHAKLLSQFPNLQYIGVLATGYNVIDVSAARKLGITVTNVPTYGTDAVAQHTIALILELSNQVGLHNQSVQAGEWTNNPDWTYTKKPIMELSGKALGLIGYGKIGQKVASIARALGMQIIYHTPQPKNTALDQYASLEELFITSDIISLHLPLKPDNQEFINKALIHKMKRSALLINTSRGGLIHEQDLAETLKNGIIAGAALDVLSTEPPQKDNPLLNCPNTIITPHNAWVAKEARQRLLNTAIENLKAFLKGERLNVVN